MSVKLPASGEGALEFPFCEPTGYGLGRSGWVTATFGPKDRPPRDVLRSWMDESYRAVAPKRLFAAAGAAPVGRAAARKAIARARRPRPAARPRRSTAR